MNEFLPITLENEPTHDIFKMYNTCIKTYANGEQKIKYHSYDILKGKKNDNLSTGKKLSDDEKTREVFKSLYRSKQNVIDLAYHNSLIEPWEYFVTLEFNSNEIDYKDYDKVSELLAMFLDNLHHQNKDMRYIGAPELHPKSGGIHYHFLMSNVPNLKLEEARSPKTGRIIYKNGSKIYNITNYKHGFTTCSKIKNQEAVSVYIAKYITKNMIDYNYKKRYWCSRNLSRPTLEYAYFDEDNLKFYINKQEVLEYKEVEKDCCKSIFSKIKVNIISCNENSSS